MASLTSLYIKKETLQKIISVLEQKKESGIEITISLNDELNNYAQNASAFVSQSKEHREAKKEKFYIGNGKTFWSDGSISVVKFNPETKESHIEGNRPVNAPTTNNEVVSPGEDDLPF